MEIRKKLSKYGLTEFQKKVLMAAYCIPKGNTMSYKKLAQKIGHPNAYRAVGTALRKNPLPLVIPCHRVIKSSGETGRYSGKGGSRFKYRILKKEGAI